MFIKTTTKIEVTLFLAGIRSGVPPPLLTPFVHYKIWGTPTPITK